MGIFRHTRKPCPPGKLRGHCHLPIARVGGTCLVVRNGLRFHFRRIRQASDCCARLSPDHRRAVTRFETTARRVLAGSLPQAKPETIARISL
jgi:hypothetical protein